MGVPHPVPGQIPGHNRAFHAKNFYTDYLFSHSYDTGLDDTSLVDPVHACRIAVQIENLPFLQHGLLSACDHATGFGVNPLYHKINMGAQHIVQNLVLAQHQIRISLTRRTAPHLNHHFFERNYNAEAFIICNGNGFSGIRLLNPA